MRVSSFGLRRSKDGRSDAGENPSRIVLLAYACNPNAGSEPGAGWAMVRAASEIGLPIDLVTRNEPNNELERACDELGVEIRVRRVSTLLDGSRNVYLRYLSWVISVCALVFRQDRQDRTGLIFHHATYASDWFLSPLMGVSTDSKNRTVWGPVGGSTYTPRALLPWLPRRAWLVDIARTLATTAFRRVTLMLLRGRVDYMLCLNADSVRSLRKAGRVQQSGNAAIDYSTLPSHASSNDGWKRVIFAGRLLPWKGLQFAVKSFELLPENWTLTIIGDGDPCPVLDDASAKARERISVIDRLDRADFIRLLAQSDVLVFPSFRDSAGWVAAEAAGIGLPVVCLDVAGVSYMAGTRAYVVPHLPIDSLESRLAAGIVDAERSDPGGKFTGWDHQSLVSVLRKSYGVELCAS